jgi:hypothetical protein
MKYTLIALLLSAPGLFASADDFINFVRQTEYDTFVQWDVPVGESGRMSSPQGLGDLGSLYELVSIDKGTGEEMPLDQEFVSDYSPTVSMSFETGDPYPVVARTRVDQPVTMRIRVDGTGALTGSAAAAYDGLEIQHEGVLYPDGVLSPYELEGQTPEFTNSYSLDTGVEMVIDFPAATLAATDVTKTTGVEMFYVGPSSSNNGHGNNADDADVSNKGRRDQVDASGSIDDETFAGGKYIIASVLDQAALQVWPIAEASIFGIDATKVHDEVPPFTVDLTDLYPDSRTYIRIYEGGPTSNPTNPIIVGSTAAVINDAIPQDRTMTVDDLDEFIPHSGTYTVEVLHDTPFGTDVLTQFYPLKVEWKIEFRGTLYTGR